MWKLLKFIPLALKYLINVGPLLYEAVKFSIKVVKDIKPKPTPAPENPKPTVPKRIDPG
jgi:hypothetical protein